MTQPVIRTGGDYSFDYSGTYDGGDQVANPLSVPRQTNVEVGDLMVAIIGLTDPAPNKYASGDPLTAANVFNEDNPNVQGPAGWTFRGSAMCAIDYSNYTGLEYLGVDPQTMLVIFTKRATHEDVGADAPAHYPFTRAHWDYPGGQYNGIPNFPPGKFPANTRARVGMLVIRYGKFAGLSKDSIGYGYLAGSNPIRPDPATRGGIEPNTTKEMVHAPPAIATSAATDQVLAISIAFMLTTAVTTASTSGTMLVNTGGRPRIAQQGALEGPSALPPSQTRTFSGGTQGSAYYGAGLGMIFEPADAMLSFGITPPVLVVNATEAPTALMPLSIDGPTMSMAANSVDPVPVGNVNDYIISWSPYVFYKLDGVTIGNAGNNYAANVFVDSSGNGRTSGPWYATATTAKQVDSLLASTYAQPGWRVAPNSGNDIQLNGSTEFPNGSALVRAKYVSVSFRVRPEQDGPLIAHEYAFASSRQWIASIVNGKLRVQVWLANMMEYVAEDPNPVVFGDPVTVGFKWDGDFLALFRDGVKVANFEPDTTIRGLNQISYGYLTLASGYYATGEMKGAFADLAIFDYPLPDSVFANIHRLMATNQAMVTDPPIWGVDQPPAAPVADAYGQAVLADSPAYYFRMDEQDSDAYLRDSSGNGRDVVLNPRVFDPDITIPDMQSPGLLASAAGHSAGFDGTANSYSKRARISFLSDEGAKNPAPASTGWSVELLLQRTVHTFGDIYPLYMYFGEYSQANLVLGINNTNVFAAAGTTKVVAQKYNQSVAKAPPGFETRYHYVITYDGSMLRLYADGGQVGSIATSAGAYPNPPSSATLGANMAGYIDELAIYPTVLSATRVQAHWDATGLIHPGLAEDVVIPTPPVRGTLLEESFEGGAVGAPITEASIAERITIAENSGDPFFVASGKSGNAAGATSPVGLVWTDEFKNAPNHYYRAAFKIDTSGVESGSDASMVLAHIGEYLIPDVESSYPTGFPTGGILLMGEGGIPGPNQAEGAIPLEAGVPSAFSKTLDYGDGESPALWYRYKPSTSGTATIDTNESSNDPDFTGAYDTNIVVYTGTPGNLTQIAADTNSGGVSYHAQVTIPVSANTNYYVRVTIGQPGYGGKVSTTVRSGAPVAANDPPNTTPTGPVIMTATAQTTSALAAVTETLGEMESGLWYVFEAHYHQEAEAIVYRFSDSQGNLLAETSMAHGVVPLSLLGLEGKGAPYGWTTYFGGEWDGGISVVMDDMAVSDEDWLGAGASAPAPVVVEGGQASETDAARTGAVVVGGKTILGTKALESDQALTGVVRVGVRVLGGQALEDDDALTGSSDGSTVISGGKAIETSVLTQLGRALDLATIERTDMAQPGSFSQSSLLATIFESSTLFSLGRAGTLTLARQGVLDIGTEALRVIPSLRVRVMDEVISRAPQSVTITVAGGSPNRELRLYIDNQLVWTTTADSEGGLDLSSLGISNEDSFASKGTHTVTARQTTPEGYTLEGSDTFRFLNPPAMNPQVMIGDTSPVDVPGSLVTMPNGAVVRRWVFQDLLPQEVGGIGSYVFSRNPMEMSSPHLEKPLAAKHTTAPDGQYHIYEAGKIPKEWVLTGFCANTQEREALEKFRDLNRRFWVIDHHRRAWKVVLTHLGLTPKTQQNFNGKQVDPHDYEITLTILDQKWITPTPYA